MMLKEGGPGGDSQLARFVENPFCPFRTITPLASFSVDKLPVGFLPLGFGACAHCCNTQNIPGYHGNTPVRPRPGTDTRVRILRYAINAL